MTLGEFKEIYAFEYTHRLLGRVIGLAFFLPFVVFMLLRKVDRQLVPRLLLLFVLGGMQGLMGWVMVQSGLVDHPDVSHYRLTAHLGLACLIFSALVWTALDLFYSSRGPLPAQYRSLRRWSCLLLSVIFIQILVGGFVAGLNAGLVYNEWPLMSGGLWPPDLFFMTPLYMNFLENVATIQFVHRIVAYLVFALALVLFIISRRSVVSVPVKRLVHGLLAVIVLQIALGIWTLLAVVPVSLGTMHQAGGLLVLTLSLVVTHRVSRS
jgi:cytochrome c oxidase assembly protein subunit 15